MPTISAQRLKTRKARQTREKILETAKEVFARRGFHRATVHDIVKKANLGYGTFYLYFRDKKDIFYALVAQVEADLYTAANGGIDLDQEYGRGREAYRALRKDLKAVFESFMNNAAVIKLSRELAETDNDFRKDYSAMKSRLIERTRQILIKSKVQGMNFEIAAVAISGMIESVATAILERESQQSEAHPWFNELVLPTITKLYFKAVS